MTTATHKISYYADPGDFQKGWNSYPVAEPIDDPEGFFTLSESHLDAMLAKGELQATAEEVDRARAEIRRSRKERNLPALT